MELTYKTIKYGTLGHCPIDNQRFLLFFFFFDSTYSWFFVCFQWERRSGKSKQERTRMKYCISIVPLVEAKVAGDLNVHRRNNLLHIHLLYFKIFWNNFLQNELKMLQTAVDINFLIDIYSFGAHTIQMNRHSLMYVLRAICCCPVFFACSIECDCTTLCF